MTLKTQLTQLIKKSEVSLNETQIDLLIQYVELLNKWNKTYNLTAVRDQEQMVTRHLLDSLAIAPYLSGQRFIDVGSGAGLPGIPLAIVQPQHEIHLLDSNGKKARFLFQVKTALCLDNIVVHQARVEALQPPVLFDAVLTRAFASLQDITQCCRHLLTPAGSVLAMKGEYPAAELDALQRGSEQVAVYPLVIPGLTEQRHLVKMVLEQA